MTTAPALLAPPQTMQELRLLAALDYSRLAELSGVSAPTVSRIEQGKCRYLRGATVERIALALKKALSAREVPVELSVPEIELILIRSVKR